MSTGPGTNKGGNSGKEASEQPMDLAQKALPTLTQQQQSLTVQSQPMSLHAHLDTTKPTFTPLRVPVPARTLSTAITNSSVGPHLLASKPISRLQTEGVTSTQSQQQQGHGVMSGSLGGATLVCTQAPGVVPTRQVMTTTVYPVMSLGAAGGTTANAIPMASIIRGSTVGAPAGALYSSHMPRGPAAVASLSAGPKSAVATPILRHAPAALQQFTPRVLGMTATRCGPPLTKTPTSTITQVLDTAKLGGRPIVEGSRTASLVVAPPSVAIGKVSPGLSATTTTSTSQQMLSGPTEKYFKPLLSQHHMVSATQQVTRGTASTCMVTIAPGPQPQLRLAHPTLTVVSGKAPLSASAVAIAAKVGSDNIKKVPVGVGLSNVSSRPLQQQPLPTGGTSTPAAAIPVARVYPQQPGVSSSLDSQDGSSTRGNIYIAHAPGSGVTAVNQGTAVTASINTLPAVMLSETRSESGPLRLTSLPRGGPNAYFYDSYSGTPLQPFTMSSTASTQATTVSSVSQGHFTTTLSSANLRPSIPVISTSAPTASTGSTGIVRPLGGSLLVTVDGNRPPVALHSVNTTPATTGSSSSVTGVLSGSDVYPGASLSPSGYGVIHGNHNTSPRPSILRKRTSDITTVQGAKKNLMSCILPTMSGGSNSGSPAASPMMVDPPGAVGVSAPISSLGKTILPAPSLVPQPSTTTPLSISSAPLTFTTSSMTSTTLSTGATASALPLTSAACTAASTLATIASSLITAAAAAATTTTSSTLTTTTSSSRDTVSENGFQLKKDLPGLLSVKVEPQDSSPQTVSKPQNSQFPVPNGVSPMEASPRKKPRKQQLGAQDLMESHSTDGEDIFGREVKGNVKKIQLNEDDSCKWVTYSKRPCMSLLNSFQHSWKSRHNHFLRHSDVKPKDEKKPSVNELANQKGVLQKTSGWKIYYLATQMDEVREAEQTVQDRLGGLLGHLEQKSHGWKKPLGSDEERIMGKLTDLIKGNLQRSKIVQDQIGEVKQQVVKVVDHKTHVNTVINKYISKRHIKKKSS